MKISVVMTTFNGSKYVEEQMESIRNQTVHADEVLIYDDCSTDMNTQKLISSFISKNVDDNWKLFINEHNIGWKKNFIQAINCASGDIVFLADQDDVWCTTKIEKMLNIMKEHPEINVLCSNFELLNETNMRIRSNSTQTMINNGQIIKISITKKFHLVGRPGCTYCIRKNFANDILPMWEVDYAHDQLFWLAGILSGSLYCLNEQLIRYRRYGGNASGKGPQTNNIKREENIKKDLSVIQRIIDNDIAVLNESEEKVINGFFDWNNLRCKMLEFRRVFYWLKACRYIGYYSSFKSYLGDLYSILKSGS